jgi:hypothetical protein
MLKKPKAAFTILALIVVSAILLVYAFIQKGEAEKAHQQALQSEIIAWKNEHIAKANAVEAIRLEQELKAARLAIREKDSIISVLTKTRK